MNNTHEETKKILTGILLGTIGAGALYYWYVQSHKKIPVMQKIGRTISDVGEMIENYHFDGVTRLAETVEKKLPDGADVLNDISQWISTARSFWKKISK